MQQHHSSIVAPAPPALRAEPAGLGWWTQCLSLHASSCPIAILARMKNSARCGWLAEQNSRLVLVGIPTYRFLPLAPRRVRRVQRRRAPVAAAPAIMPALAFALPGLRGLPPWQSAALLAGGLAVAYLVHLAWRFSRCDGGAASRTTRRLFGHLACIAATSHLRLHASGTSPKPPCLRRADADLELLSKPDPPRGAFTGKVVWLVGASQVRRLCVGGPPPPPPLPARLRTRPAAL